jgi:hypothetical protein
MLEFSDDAIELIQSGQLEYILSEKDGDYIQLIVFDDSDNIIKKSDDTLAIFYSNRNVAGDIITFSADNIPVESPQIPIYRDTSNKVFIKTNEVLSIGNIPTGNYKIKIDYLKNTFSNDFTEDGADDSSEDDI